MINRLLYCLSFWSFFMMVFIIYYIYDVHKTNTSETFIEHSLKHTSPEISFPSKTEFDSLVRSTSYFSDLSQADLYARHVSTRDEYIQQYISSYIDISEDVKTDMILLIQKCNDILKKFSQRMYSIPWNIVLISNHIENGYPHTHGNVIVISPRLLKSNNDINIINTLIHEKVHIFQRLYPELCNTIITKMGFYKFMKKVDVDVFSRQIRYTIYPRSNPDLDEYVYSYAGKIIIQSYLKDKPMSIADSHVLVISEEDGSLLSTSELSSIIPYYVQQIEHPYEIMACIVPKLANGSVFPSTLIEKVITENI